MKSAKGNEIFIPNREWILNLRIDDNVLDCFGRFNKIVEIFMCGKDMNGKAYVGVYTANGSTSRISQSFKEERIVRTVPLCSEFTSHELDEIERKIVRIMNAKYADNVKEIIFAKGV